MPLDPMELKRRALQEQSMNRFQQGVESSVPGLLVKLPEQAPGVMWEGLKRLGSFGSDLLSDPFGDTPDAPKGLDVPRAVPAELQEQAGPAAEEIYTDPSGLEQGPSKADLLGENSRQGQPANSRVSLKTLDGQEYDYRGAGRGLPMGQTLPEGSGSYSQIGLSADSPGSELLRQGEDMRQLDEIKRKTAIASGQDAFRVASQSPQEREAEKRGLASAELEGIMGENRGSFIQRNISAALTQLQNDPRFAELPPEGQQAAVNAARSRAEQNAHQEYNNSIKELYIRKFQPVL